MKKAQITLITNKEELAEIRRVFSERKTRVENQPIKQLFYPWLQGRYIFPEEYQRAEAWTWRAKGRPFIQSVLEDQHTDWFNPLHIQQFNDFDQYGDKDMLAVIDGQQRLTALKNWFLPTMEDGKATWPFKLAPSFTVKFKSAEGKFCYLELGGLSWNQIIKNAETDRIMKEFVEWVREKRISVIQYEGYEAEEMREIFHKLNSTEPLNDQEKRNAIGGVACSTIRSIARFGSKNSTHFHRLFELGPKGKTQWMKVKTNRLNLEKVCATILAHNLFESGQCDKLALNKMYEENKGPEPKFNEALKKTIRQFDLVFKAVSRDGTLQYNSLLKESQLLIACLVTGLLDKTSKDKAVVKDAWKFLSEVLAYHTKLEKDINCFLQLGATRYEYTQLVNKGYKGGNHIQFVMEQWKPFVELVLNNPENYGIVLKDAKRTITDKEKVEAYILQGGKDASTNEPAPIDALVKGHVVAHAKGGRSTVENTVLISASENSQMGAETYTNKE